MGDVGGRHLRCNASFGDILLIGEQLRIQMHTEGDSLVRDHRLRFRTHVCCFLANETIDWLVRVTQAPDRACAIFLMNVLVQNEIIHHVMDSQHFADAATLYRFRQDDGTYPWFNDLSMFLQGQQLYIRCASIRQKGDGDTVRGDELVSWMIQNGEAGCRTDAVREARKMLEGNIIRHVTDEQHFRDEPSLYRFPANFGRKRTLLDLVQLPPGGATDATAAETAAPSGRTVATDIPAVCDGMDRAESGYHSDNVDVSCSNSSQSASPPSHDRHQMTPHSGVIIRKATVGELEDENSAYRKRRIRIASDAVGFGFVIRGEGPVFVNTVDPTGPAAVSGLKVGHFIYSVNGEKVLASNHRDLAHTILDMTLREVYVTLVVMEHRGDAT